MELTGAVLKTVSELGKAAKIAESVGLETVETAGKLGVEAAGSMGAIEAAESMGKLGVETAGSMGVEGKMFSTSGQESISFTGRSRSSIERDLHEAKSKFNYNTERYEHLVRNDPSQIMAIGGYKSAANSWGHRLAKLQDELRRCED